METMRFSYRLLVLLAICFNLQFEQCVEIYITPSSYYSPCPVKKCFSLSQVSNKSVLDSLTDSQNTTLIFLSGDYKLESNILMMNASNITVISRTSNVSIFCHQNAGLKFEGIKWLVVKGLKFFSCGNNKVKLVKNILMEKVSFVGENKSETALEIDRVVAYIIDTSFMYNTVGSLRGPIRILQGHKRQHAYVGGAIIANHSNITIIRSEFLGNRAEIGGAIFATQVSKIVINNSSFIGNSAMNYSVGFCFGGVLYTDSGVNGADNPIAKTLVVLSKSKFSSNSAKKGAVLATINSTVDVYSS